MEHGQQEQVAEALYSPELKERAVRVALDLREEDPGDCEGSPIVEPLRTRVLLGS